MKFIASDHRNVVYYNTDNGFSKILHKNKGVYYGITWDDNQNLILAIGDFVHLIKLNDSSKQVNGYIEAFGKRSERFLSSPHQILYHEDLLYVVDTGRNRMITLDRDLKIQKIL